MLRPSYNAYGGRHTTRTAAAILSPIRFNLKRDIFRAKNQYDKMEEKKLCGAKKQYTSIEGQGYVARKKNVPRNGRINISKQKKK